MTVSAMLRSAELRSEVCPSDTVERDSVSRSWINWPSTRGLLSMAEAEPGPRKH